MEYYKHKNRMVWHALLFPFIWAIFVPLLILDFFISLYHFISFGIYGFKRLKRSDYVKIDRHKLKYLKLHQKINCVYCGYANGLLNYSLTIAGMTEKYWCGIKHQNKENFVQPEHHKDFVEYGDKEGFEREYIK